MKPEEVKELFDKYNISASQLPKISSNDPALPENCVRGDVIKIEKKEDNEINVYYRIVV